MYFIIGACYAGWEEFGDRCYFFNFGRYDDVVWPNAKERCEEVGAELLVINNEEENDFIFQNLPHDSEYWIGIHSKYTTGGLRA